MLLSLNSKLVMKLFNTLTTTDRKCIICSVIYGLISAVSEMWQKREEKQKQQDRYQQIDRSLNRYCCSSLSFQSTGIFLNAEFNDRFDRIITPGWFARSRKREVQISSWRSHWKCTRRTRSNGTQFKAQLRCPASLLWWEWLSYLLNSSGMMHEY